MMIYFCMYGLFVYFLKYFINCLWNREVYKKVYILMVFINIDEI